MATVTALDTDRPAEQRPIAGVGLRLLTALLLAIMFALVKLASTRGVNSGTSVRSAFTSPTDTACSSTRGLVFSGSAGIFPNRSSHPDRRFPAQIGAVATASGT